MIKYLISFLFLFSFFSSCHKYTQAEREEKRRAEAELQSVLSLASSREIPPIDFEFNSAKLKPSSYPLLDKVAEILLKYPRLKLIVEGHTDDVGDADYNYWLSMQRADSVKTYLVKKGIYPDFIRIRGYGESRPIVKENSQKARDLNRRVEFKLTGRSWETVF
ncbi:MAG: OmpA family protein [Elusimicrobiota bacterium]